MKLKLDLHTHCYEATGYRPADVDIVAKIVARIKARGLDGIAVTEHWDVNYGRTVRNLVAEHFNNEVLIIPGREIDVDWHQEVELYLPNGGIFRFLVHPDYPTRLKLDGNLSHLQGIEVENALHPIDREKVLALAEKFDLLLLRNSDAHYLNNVGELYNEISLEELYARAPVPSLES